MDISSTSYIYGFLAIQWPAVIVHMCMIIAMSLFDHYVLGYTAIKLSLDRSMLNNDFE